MQQNHWMLDSSSLIKKLILQTFKKYPNLLSIDKSVLLKFDVCDAGHIKVQFEHNSYIHVHLQQIFSSSSCLPRTPFIDEISNQLEKWIKLKQFPITFSNEYKLLKEDTSYYQSLNKLTPKLLECNGDIEKMKDFLLLLGKRGILTLLQLRKTAQSIDYFPPTRSELLKSFTQIKNKGNLSVGARALSKHYHRDKTDKFWGTIKGNSEIQNKNAKDVLIKIIENATFMNIHYLPVCIRKEKLIY